MEGRQKRAFLGGRASPARNPPYCLVWAQAPLWPPGEVLPLLILQEASGHCLLFGICWTSGPPEAVGHDLGGGSCVPQHAGLQ